RCGPSYNTFAERKKYYNGYDGESSFSFKQYSEFGTVEAEPYVWKSEDPSRAADRTPKASKLRRCFPLSKDAYAGTL
ncbi:MAG: hypothetical protein LUC17_02290, partial [Oscillospiraceae bacterium]|nr:hypothetical protein [Oscillospiraceae bacterium]